MASLIEELHSRYLKKYRMDPEGDAAKDGLQNQTNLKKQERPPPWKEIMYNYTQETTMHGVRFTTLPAKYMARRVVWCILLLGSLALFCYLLHGRIMYLKGNPKAVNVEVTYADQLKFPAVTVCNENLYRLTAIFEEGLYDLFVNELDNFIPIEELSQETESCVDDYTFVEDICSIPITHFDNDLYSVLINDTTRKTCKHLCSGLYNLTCSSILYNSEDLSCLISAYTGKYHDNEKECLTSPMEFYSRTRCIQLGSFECDFETNDCPLYDNTTMEDQWKVVMASSYQINKDNTLNMGSGRYIYLLETGRRPEYGARILTDYLDTTGKCLTLLYWRLGIDPATLKIYVRNEEMHEFIMHSVSNKRTVDDWQSLLVHLPSGIYQVVIEGKRGTQGNSGLAIDDIILDDCDEIVPDCIRTSSGKDYRGKTSTTGSGDTCQRWNSNTLLPFLGDKVLNLPDTSVDDASNYCRNIPELGWTEPMCYNPWGIPTSCAIPYCGCKPGEYQCVSDGFCLPWSFTCDGESNCQDGSDESIPCNEKLHIHCDFEEAYQCGYQQHQLVIGISQWGRNRGTGLAKNTSPKADSDGSLVGSKSLNGTSGVGWYMTTDSRATAEGDNLILMTPEQEFSRNIELVYWLHMKLNPLDDVARLAMYTTTKSGRPVRRVHQVTQSANVWTRQVVCLPAGTYALMISAIAGRTYESDIAIDSLFMGGECQPEPEVATIDNGTADCYFTSDTRTFCNWQTYASNSHALWRRGLAEDALSVQTAKQEEGCNKDFTDPTGTILSPNYPEQYTNGLLCLYRIIMPINYTIEITFVDINIESAGSSCPYDWVQVTYSTGENVESANEVWNSGRLCGSHSTSPSYNHAVGNIVSIQFKTDNVVAMRGFSLQYTSQSSGQVKLKYALLASFTGDSTFIEHKSWLLSPPISNIRHCLRSRILVQTGLLILFEYSEDQKSKKDTVIDIRSSLGNAFHDVDLSFGGQSSPENLGRLVLETKITTVPDHIAAAIAFLDVDKGSCFNTSWREKRNIVEKQLRCNFERQDNCGYIDESIGSYRWTRKKADTFVMAADIGPRGTVSSLISPLVNFINTTCLTLNYRIESLKNTPILLTNVVKIFKISISTINETSDTIKMRGGHRPYIWNTIHATLPSGIYRVKLDITSEEDIDLSLGLHVQMDSVHSKTGTCEESASSGIECTFETVDMCGYTTERTSGGSSQLVWYREYATHYPYNYIWPNASTFDGSDNWLMTFGDLVDGSIPGVPSILYSPTHTFESPTVISFWYSIHGGSIDVYKYSSTFEYKLAVLAPPVNSSDRFLWQKHILCAPPGEYQLAFVGAVKANQYTAIDDIAIDAGDSCNYTELKAWDISCTFIDEDICGYIIKQPSSSLEWVRQPKDQTAVEGNSDASYSGAEEVLTAPNGMLTSPGYPEKYPNYADSLTYIQLPVNSSITFTFITFRIEEESSCSFDYLQIGTPGTGGWFEGSQHNKLCGYKNPSPITLYGKIFAVKFVSDSSVKKKGYEIEYTSVSLEEDDTPRAMFAIKSEITDGETLVKTHLYTPVAVYNAPICLKLPLFINGTLGINLFTDAAIPTSILSRKEKVAYGKDRVWNILKIPLDLKNTSQYQLEIIASTLDSVKSTVAVLDIVTVENGSCISEEIRTIDKCSFSESDQCGFLDQSSRTGHRWLRVEVPFNGQNITNGTNPSMVMQTELYQYMETNRMISPLYNVTKPTCLSFNYLMLNAHTRITVTAIDNGTRFSSELFGGEETEVNTEWRSGLVDLPSGIYRLEFAASLVQVQFNVPIAVSISNLNYTTGLCLKPIVLTTTSAPIGVVTTKPFTSNASGLLSFQKVVNRHGARSMRNLTQLIGHQEESMIHTCSWLSQSCDKKYLLPEFTEKGYCMSFNKDEMEFLNTTRTGAEFGVRLTLNIEQYQHLKGYSVDAGIKVHLHGQDDISSVKDLGFAVAPGAHALAGITFTSSKSLPEPYGPCLEGSDKSLISYPGQNYTQLKCQQDCKTKSLVENCHCKAIHMPGTAPVCTMEQYLNCELQWESLNETSSKIGCDCPDACLINSYAIELSTSQLSGLSVQSLLSENRDEIQKSFINALEVKARVEEDILANTIALMEDTIGAYERFIDDVQFNVIQTATSVTDRIQDAIYKMQILSLSETMSVLNDSRVLQEKYRTFRDPAIRYIITHLDKAAEDVTKVRDIVEVDNPDAYFEGSWILKSVKSASEAVHDLSKVLKLESLFEIPPNYKEYLPPNLYGSDDEFKTCNESLTKLIAEGDHGLPELKIKLDEYLATLDNLGYDDQSGFWTGLPGSFPGGSTYGGGTTPAYGSSGTTPGYGYGGTTPAYGSSGTTPGYGSSGTTPGYGYGGTTPGYGSSGTTPGYDSLGTTPGYSSGGITTLNYGGGGNTPGYSSGGYSDNSGYGYSSYGYGGYYNSYGYGSAPATPLPPPDWLQGTTTTTTAAPGETTVLPTSGFSTNIDLSTLAQTMSYILTYRNCTTQYRIFLEEVNTWLDELKNVDYILSFDFENMLRQFRTDISWLRQTKDEYLLKQRSKLSLANLITSDRSSLLMDTIEKEFTNINNQILSPLNEFTSRASEDVVRSYIQMLEYVARFKEFFKERDRFEARAKATHIFRTPVPNIETPKIITYTLDEDKIHTLWPSNQPIQSFLGSTGKDILKNIVQGYFTVLATELSTLNSEFSDLKNDFTNNMTKLQTSLQEFITSTEVGETFVMENFMKLDIYFGELKYERIEQQPAYGILQFFSEIGGYMGLLLGGSLITVLELLDLFVYNTLIKIVNSKGDKKISPSKTNMTGSNRNGDISKDRTTVITDHGPPSYNTIPGGQLNDKKTDYNTQYSA